MRTAFREVSRIPGALATLAAGPSGGKTGVKAEAYGTPLANSGTTASALNFTVSNDQNLRDSYIQQWNLNIQRKLPGNVVLDAGYVGSKGTRLIVTIEELNTAAIRLPGIENLDFSVNKHFRIGERRTVEFRTEIFNLLNHFSPDPATVDRNIRSQTFGAVGGGVQGITTRIIQLARLNF